MTKIKLSIFLFFILIVSAYSVVYNPKIKVTLPEKNIPYKSGRQVKDYNLANYWCDKWIDTTSFQTILADIFEPGMTNEEKAIAVWNFGRIYVYHETFLGDVNGMAEFVNGGTTYQENMEWPLKTINVYGFHLCGINAFVSVALWQTAGFKAERVGFTGYGHHHCELFYDNFWHWLDINLVCYLYTRDGSRIANLEDINKDPKLMTDQEVKKSPSYLPGGNDINDVPKYVPFVSHPHSGNESYTRTKNDYDTVKMNLYKGMGCKFYWQTREAIFYYPKGSEQAEGANNRKTTFKVSGNREEMPEWVKTYGVRKWETGQLIYQPNLKSDDFLDNATNIQGLEYQTGQLPTLRTKKVGEYGEITFSIALPYIISEAILEGSFVKKTNEDINEVYTSVYSKTSSFIKVWTNSQLGENKIKVNLGSNYNQQGTVFGRYKYWVKLRFKANKDIQDCGLNDLKITTYFNYNKVCLPRLSYGKNKLKIETASNTDLKNNKLNVTFAWNERGTNARSGLQQKTEIITTNPYPYEIEVNGSKEPMMQYLEFKIDNSSLSINEREKKDTYLGQSYPNPFNPECFIPYEIRYQTSDIRHQTVKIKIYNILGQVVKELDLGEKPVGSYVTKDKAAYWDGRDVQGKEVVSGVYYYELVIDGKVMGMKKGLVVK